MKKLDWWLSLHEAANIPKIELFLLRNQHGWSDLSKPLIIRTPNTRKGSTNKYPELESFGYVGRNNRTGAEVATEDDWEWWEANKPKE